VARLEIALASLWTSSLRRIIEVRSRPADLDRGLRVTSSAHGDQWSTLKPSVALHEPAIYLKAWLEGGMKLEIFKVENGGDHTQEAVWLKALEDCNLNLHILADSTFDEEGRSNLVRHTYWFPYKLVKAGDFIIVYTKSGKPRFGKTKSQNPVHLLYWDLKEAIWNNDGDQAVLIEIADSVSFNIPPA
jgi:hypothetical protein